MDHTAYEAIIEDAIAALPEAMRKQLENVAIVVEDTAPPHGRGILLGLYQGVPLPVWGRGMSSIPPDKITLFRTSIEQVAQKPEDIPALVRETLWHEIAHYFGFDHEHIHRMEERWRLRRGNADPHIRMPDEG